MSTVKLSTKNQMVLPREARERLGVGPGDELLVVSKGRSVVIVTRPDDSLGALRGSGRGVYGDSERYLRRERKTWKKRGSPRR